MNESLRMLYSDDTATSINDGNYFCHSAPWGTTPPLRNAGHRSRDTLGVRERLSRTSVLADNDVQSPSTSRTFSELWNNYDWNAHDKYVGNDLHHDRISIGSDTTAVDYLSTRPSSIYVCQPCLPSSPPLTMNDVPTPSTALIATDANRRNKYENVKCLSKRLPSISESSTDTEATAGESFSMSSSSRLSSSTISSKSSTSSSSSSSFKPREVWCDDKELVFGLKFIDIRTNGQVSYSGQVHSTTKVPHGKGTLHFSDGRIFNGEWHEGILVNPRPNRPTDTEGQKIFPVPDRFSRGASAA